ncbi:uncharacterized protein LOC110433622 [Sorghum bicolor]|uniref:uncharacterized protein LOC110433622 n=1 Tax=Sorghum bicolor TaxID=4558 RepID=UPI000B423F65|nr:uncharacterized protein LOC110433622 [Sorghum bicolor]|eukprot:XP_021311789.1 uncharacterized protein LOC110433622 [Sorghum bicolor]
MSVRTDRATDALKAYGKECRRVGASSPTFARNSAPCRGVTAEPPDRELPGPGRRRQACCAPGRAAPGSGRARPRRGRARARARGSAPRPCPRPRWPRVWPRPRAGAAPAPEAARPHPGSRVWPRPRRRDRVLGREPPGTRAPPAPPARSGRAARAPGRPGRRREGWTPMASHRCPLPPLPIF